MRLDTRSRAIRRAQPAGSRARLEVRGKFFFAGDEKVPLRGVTYGPFAPDADGYRYPAPQIVDRDFALMTELVANCLRLFTPPPRWLLDMAAARKLWVLVGIPWAEHICFLDSEEISDSVRRTVTDVVEACRNHPAVGAFLVGNEDGGSLRRVTLKEFLGNIRDYLSEPDSWKGSRESLLAPRDTHALVSAQAAFLPIPQSGKATFNPVLFNYQSSEGDPAVLTILATREGTSVTIIERWTRARSAVIPSSSVGPSAPQLFELLWLAPSLLSSPLASLCFWL